MQKLYFTIWQRRHALRDVPPTINIQALPNASHLYATPAAHHRVRSFNIGFVLCPAQ